MTEGGLLWECVRAIVFPLIVLDRGHFELAKFFAGHRFLETAIWVLLFAGYFLLLIEIKLREMHLDQFGGAQHLKSRFKSFRKLRAAHLTKVAAR